ncbi:M48 family metallopeptidase [Flavisphingomonas formosensis]|uniref:M48 family metallopeptidase n=1 Tax=Flavisphingomonas formosensis TaxID=861534 RepID=UPI0018E02178
MRGTSRITLSTASSELVFRGGGRERPLVVRRMAQARSMRLSVDPRDGTVRLSLPKRAALKPALKWVEGKREWIERALEGVPAPHPIRNGAAIPFEGGLLTVTWSAGAPRTVRREGDRLVLGGAEESLEPRVLRWLKREALERLERETRACAETAGVTVGRVSIGDPRARWGSCSSTGDIRYSWRLILAPADVLRATVAHEVAHRLHMDHSPRFHAAVARLFGREPVAERRWLRTHGPSLYCLGRS